MSRRLQTQRAVAIAAGNSLSDAVPVGSARLAAVLLPSDWTIPALLTFLISFDGTQFHEITYPESESSYYFTEPGVLCFFEEGGPWPSIWAVASHVKFRSGSAGNPVNQAAEREVIAFFVTD